DAAEAFSPGRFRMIMRFLRRLGFWLRFHQRPADTARTTFDNGRLICHPAVAKLLAILPLAIAMILPDLWILLIPAVRFSSLLLATDSPASLTAVGLSAITGTADEKHQPTIPTEAKPLSKQYN